MHDLGASLRRLPADTARAMSFFSRLPLRPPDGPFVLAQAAGAWPLAGLLLSLPPAALLLLAGGLQWPPSVATLLALASGAALSGALHEDGLADCADGLGGGKTREAKLAIMRDSRIGTYGALALTFSILLRVAALSAIMTRPMLAASALLGAAMLSRATALLHWATTEPARADGLALSAGRPGQAALTIGTVGGAVAGLGLLAAFGWPALLGVALSVTGVALFSRRCRRAIGGHTGDTIGAAQQISETLLLVGLSAGSHTL